MPEMFVTGATHRQAIYTCSYQIGCIWKARCPNTRTANRPGAAGEAHRASWKFASTAVRATRCEPGRLALRCGDDIWTTRPSDAPSNPARGRHLPTDILTRKCPEFDRVPKPPKQRGTDASRFESGNSIHRMRRESFPITGMRASASRPAGNTGFAALAPHPRRLPHVTYGSCAALESSLLNDCRKFFL